MLNLIGPSPVESPVHNRPVPETEGPLFNPPALRKDVEIFKVQEHVYFQVYWKEHGPGKGPAVLLYLFGIETIKFDIFGKNKGHYHVNPNNPEVNDVNVIWLPEDTAAKQVRRVVFELRRNVHYYLQRNVDERIRNLELDEVRWNEVLERVEQRVMTLLETVPDIRGI